MKITETMVLFWKSDEISNFTVDNIEYNCAEQFRCMNNTFSV